MNYLERIDPELKKNARSFPFNRLIIGSGNIFQEVEWRLSKCPHSSMSMAEPSPTDQLYTIKSWPAFTQKEQNAR